MSAELAAKYPDVHPFLLKKWERIFNAFFDSNAGGEVDWGDFYLVTRKVRDIYGAESEQMQTARESLKTLWAGLLKMADENRDKKVSIHEWVDCLRDGRRKGENKWFLDYLTYMFKLFDVSCDNLLDIAEYADGMATYGFGDAHAHEAYHKFAVDNNGRPLPRGVDFPTFRKLWHEYFYSKDPKALGNNLFGLMTS